MKHLFVVSYDICDDKRLRRVHSIMKGFGEPIQYSVFACRLTEREKVLLINALEPEINPEQDRVMIINIGPETGEWRERIEIMGKGIAPPEKGPTIV